ncbi:peptidoglycan bridge formation glycyltransferase FemA/FemB family protein [Candidatus Dojkabacteria bacterium]|uniref:Peptidoglycan bridge formation glycyltransferase FemA/FemB family protein n=1 Tax=Candidatus Dojkabacteria bacterium TaxID=2099670 RepID=A0A3M0Z1I3_9BACT|nr:MAG: peptidoglycan bridge formation glycyltransferase FemA/FemB family protein [Candidatus Dojkabacteria bacterium]
MKITDFIGSDSEWDGLVSRFTRVIDGFFYYSNWISFQKELGKKIERKVIQNDQNEIIGVFYTETHRRKFTRYCYIPGGLLHSKDLKINDLIALYASLKSFLEVYCAKEKVYTGRFDCFFQYKSSESKFLEDAISKIFSNSFSVGLPKYFGTIDLTMSETSLWSKVSSSSRNNVNKALAKGLISKKIFDVDLFYSLLRETSDRKNFLIYNREYFTKQLQFLGSNVDIWGCFLKEKLLSVAWIIKTPTQAFYVYGASSSDTKLSKLRSSYLLHWEIIRNLKKNGFKIYNMWGVIPDNCHNLNLKGVSDFKKNMGSQIVVFNKLFEFRRPFLGFLNFIFDFFVYKKDRIN